MKKLLIIASCTLMFSISIFLICACVKNPTIEVNGDATSALESNKLSEMTNAQLQQLADYYQQQSTQYWNSTLHMNFTNSAIMYENQIIINLLKEKDGK